MVKLFKNEVCQNVKDIKNEIIREAFNYFKIKNSLEIHTVSDVLVIPD